MNERLASRTNNRDEWDQDSIALKVLLATSPYTGDAFLRSLTSFLTNFAAVKLAYVSELLAEVDEARVVAIASSNQPLEPFGYRLSGTPNRDVIISGSAAYRDSVAKKFPAHAFLTEMRAEAFIAELLRSESGDALGIIALVHDTPVVDIAPFQTLLRQLAPRVGAELERRQRDNALRRSETRFRLLAEHSKDILFYFRLQPVPAFEYISPAIEQITGYPADAFYANPELALQMVDEGDRSLISAALAAGSNEPVEARFRRADGEVGWLEYQHFPFHDADDRLIAVGGAIRDITKRVKGQEALRLSEQYMRALLEAIPDTIFRFNAEGVLLDFVPGEAMRELINPNRGALGQNVNELLPAAFSARARRLIQVALRSGQLQRIEFEVPDNGQSTFYEALCLPFGRDEALLILRDFTAIKWHQGEEDRRRLRDEIDQKVEQQVRVNPYSLTYRELAILHLVADGFADKQIAESLGISIYTVNKHVGNILGKMNAASRTEAGVRAIREGLLG